MRPKLGVQVCISVLTALRNVFVWIATENDIAGLSKGLALCVCCGVGGEAGYKARGRLVSRQLRVTVASSCMYARRRCGYEELASDSLSYRR